MAPSVGSFSARAMWGVPVPGALTLEMIPRPNVSGHESRTLGIKGTPVLLLTHTDYASAVLMAAAVVTARALKSTVVTVTDDFGVTHANQQILDCAVREQQYAPGAGGEAYQLTMEWLVMEKTPST